MRVGSKSPRARVTWNAVVKSPGHRLAAGAAGHGSQVAAADAGGQEDGAGGAADARGQAGDSRGAADAGGRPAGSGGRLGRRGRDAARGPAREHVKQGAGAAPRVAATGRRGRRAACGGGGGGSGGCAASCTGLGGLRCLCLNFSGPAADGPLPWALGWVKGVEGRVRYCGRGGCRAQGLCCVSVTRGTAAERRRGHKDQAWAPHR
jgi:hypothetical protein